MRRCRCPQCGAGGMASLAWLVPQTQLVILKLRKRVRNPMSPKEYECILIRDVGGYQYN